VRGWLAGLLIPVALAAGCGLGNTPTATRVAGRPLTMVATTTQVADLSRVIGDHRVSVYQVLKPNVDPHDYDPSPADLDALARAEVLVRNGVGLETWLPPLVRASGFRGLDVDTSRGVPIRRSGTSADPHIWQDPLNVKVMCADIEAALATKDPADAAVFEANLTSYDRQLDALDAWIRQEVATIPAADRKLVTNHDAFGYYTHRYGIDFVGSVIPSFDTSAELSGKQVAELVRSIRATGTRAVFSESSLPAKTAEAIAAEAGVRVEAGEDSLYGDTLGPSGSAGDTYLRMERHNTDVIVRALRG
jgi:ABC-type Zn uptake system ZnuABC Zn-binding protein ZnuA